MKFPIPAALRRSFLTRLILMLLTAGSFTAEALINPSFTPVELVSGSQAIVELSLTRPADDGPVRAAAGKALKGQPPAKELVFSIEKLAGPDREEFTRALGEGPSTEALFFQGNFAGASEGGSMKAAPAFLHAGGKWFGLESSGDAAYSVGVEDAALLAVWNGATPMLARAVEYVLADSAADVPAIAGAAWGAAQELGKVEGAVRGAMAVDWAADGKPGVWILSEGGDVLVKVADEKTSLHPMGARSMKGAPGPFLASGGVALVSWDGKAFSLVTKAADGDTFDVKPLAIDFDEPVVGLHAVTVGGKTGLLAAGTSRVVYVEDLAEAPKAREVVTSAAAGALGEATASVVADLTGDGAADLLWMFSEGSLLIPGGKDGLTGKPVALANAGTGKAPARAVAGDFDGDGRIDVLIGGAKGGGLLRNIDGSSFHPMFGQTGEPSYITKAGIADVVLADVNNDGRQDFIYCYPAQGALLFFNRGFASFGFAADMDLLDALPATVTGLQAAAAGDFAGRGVQDLVVVTTAGAVLRIPRDTSEQPGLGISATVVPGLGGPITVGASLEKRRLGSWSVTAGGAPAFLGVREPGPVTLDWVRPDGGKGQAEVIVEEGQAVFQVK